MGSQGDCIDWARVSISGSTGVATRGALTQDPLAEAGSPWAENRSLVLSRIAWSTERGAPRLHWELLPSTESLYSQVRGTRRKGCVETAPFPFGSRAPSPHFCGNPVALLSSSLLPSTSRGAREGANYLAINTSQEEL